MTGIPNYEPRFSDSVKKMMAEQGFKFKLAWDNYQDSDYASYERKTGYTKKYLELAQKSRERGE